MLKTLLAVACIGFVCCAVLPWAAAAGTCATAYPPVLHAGGTCEMRLLGPYCYDDSYTDGKCDTPNNNTKVCLTGDMQRTTKIWRPVDSDGCTHGCVSDTSTQVTVVDAEQGTRDCGGA